MPRSPLNWVKRVVHRRTFVDALGESSIIPEVAMVTKIYLRVLSAFQSDSNNLVEVMKVLAESSGDVYRALVQAQPITCAVKGTVFDAVPAPSAVIVDVSTLNPN